MLSVPLQLLPEEGRFHGCALTLSVHYRRGQECFEGPAAVCIDGGATIIVAALCEVVKGGHEMELPILAELSAFWRRRGHAPGQLMHKKMELDTFALLQAVFQAGGYWAVTAAQV